MPVTPTVDVLVVGGGPAVLHAAAGLALERSCVLVLEEHPVIGEPVDCSGVTDAHGLDRLGLPDGRVLGEIRVIRLISPSGIGVEYCNGGPLAYVAERGHFARTLAARAVAAGVRIETGASVTDLEVGPDGVEADDAKHLLIARDVKTSAEKVLRLIKDTKPQHRLACNAPRLKEEQYAWEPPVAMQEDA